MPAADLARLTLQPYREAVVDLAGPPESAPWQASESAQASLASPASNRG